MSSANEKIASLLDKEIIKIIHLNGNFLIFEPASIVNCMKINIHVDLIGPCPRLLVSEKTGLPGLLTPYQASILLQSPNVKVFNGKEEVDSEQLVAHVKPRYSATGANVMDVIKQEQERKAEAAADRRQALEEEMQATCTFAPTTTKPYQDSQKPVAVSGLNRFFELRGIAQKKKREQQEREAKVFQTEKIKQKSVGVTICEPFALSSTPKKRNSVTLPAECSFAPYTNESMNRDTVRRLLAGRGSPQACA